MNHLAIDTATEILSVALRTQDGEMSRQYVAVRDAGLRHTHYLVSTVDHLLREADLAPAELDLISCTRGPGSFTGLRIGMATAKGFAAAVAAGATGSVPPLVSVSTLDVMAAGLAVPGALVLPVIDAKKGRFYAAVYSRGTRLTPDLDMEPSELLRTASEAAGDGETRSTGMSLVVTGPHAQRFVDRARESAITDGDAKGAVAAMVVDPRARCGWAATLLTLAERQLELVGYDAVDQGPVYVRSSDAEIARRGSPG